VGLDPSQCLQDAPTLEMHRARIPNFLFKKIINDMEIVLKSYGLPDQQNEEASHLFLAPVSIYIIFLYNTSHFDFKSYSQIFNRTVALFGQLISDSGTGKSIMPGCVGTKDRIECQFKAFEGIIVVYIKVKLEVGTADEHLDAVAQLIAEVEGVYLILLCQHQCPVLTF
jgi:hypothetical protein